MTTLLDNDSQPTFATSRNLKQTPLILWTKKINQIFGMKIGDETETSCVHVALRRSSNNG